MALEGGANPVVRALVTAPPAAVRHLGGTLRELHALHETATAAATAIGDRLQLAAGLQSLGGSDEPAGAFSDEPPASYREILAGFAPEAPAPPAAPVARPQELVVSAAPGGTVPGGTSSVASAAAAPDAQPPVGGQPRARRVYRSKAQRAQDDAVERARAEAAAAAAAVTATAAAEGAAAAAGSEAVEMAFDSAGASAAAAAPRATKYKTVAQRRAERQAQADLERARAAAAQPALVPLADTGLSAAAAAYLIAAGALTAVAATAAAAPGAAAPARVTEASWVALRAPGRCVPFAEVLGRALSQGGLCVHAAADGDALWEDVGPEGEAAAAATSADGLATAQRFALRLPDGSVSEPLLLAEPAAALAALLAAEPRMCDACLDALDSEL